MNHRHDSQKRHSLRLSGFDYRAPGAYFVTICTSERRCVLSTTADGEVALTNIGSIVQQCWQEIPRHFRLVENDVFVIMPNHIHGILVIGGGTTVGAKHLHLDDPSAHTSAGNASPLQANGTAAGSLGAVIQNFKAISTRKVNRVESARGRTLWQRDYYEHVIRNEQSLDEIRKYISDNPWRWQQDEYFVG